jgi:mannose-6-phosphate isomerase-like protein (cupin superfamily)
MQVTRLDEAVKYSPPKHFDCFAMHLQHKTLGCEAPYWVGCSYFLPGGRAEWDASPLDKIYIVLDGEITVEFEDQVVKLKPMDSIYIGPSENREVRNETNCTATMLVVMPYPPA